MATVVTCYYKIHSKNSSETYMKWIENFMKFNFNCVIFCDNVSHKLLCELYPETPRRKYRIVEITAFICSKFDWNRDLCIDPEKNIHTIELYKLWAEKVFFIKRAIHENVFDTDFFVWTDIGSFRDVGRLQDFTNYPNINRLECDKITFLQLNPFSSLELENIDQADNRFLYTIRIGGGIFGGRSDILLKFSALYDNVLKEFDDSGIFKGKDQNLFSFIIIRNPDMFNIINAVTHNGYDKWFYLHYYLSSISITDLPVIYICPEHNEKYINRGKNTRDLLERIGFNNIQHYKSGTERYPQCLVNATINILSANLNDSPILIVEDDIGWTGIKTIDIPLDADAIYLGLSYCGGHATENIHVLYCNAIPYSDTQCRIINMLSAHAILYISKRYKQAVMNELYKIKDINYYNDVAISRIQKDYNVYGNNVPVFFQDDGPVRDVTDIIFRFNAGNFSIIKR